jgi:hypothetical protein
MKPLSMLLALALLASAQSLRAGLSTGAHDEGTKS